MIELDTEKITNAVGEELSKLPTDKRLHFTGSYTLALYSKAFEDLDSVDSIMSSICIVKSLIDAFKIGLKKEYKDAGKDFIPVEKHFGEIITSLEKVFDSYKEDGIDALKHETDLLADLIGSGLFVVNQSMRNLNWHYYEEEDET